MTQRMWSGNLEVTFTGADRETVKRILHEAEKLIEERVATASEPSGRILKAKQEYWENAETHKKAKSEA